MDARAYDMVYLDAQLLSRGQEGFAERKKKADSTLSASQPVPQASTRRALHRLTSEVERDPVHSVRYGRQRAW